MKYTIITSIIVSFLLSSLASKSQVRLPRLVRDSMVLQRDAKIKLWGWAKPGEKIRISFNGKTAKATAAKDSSWSAILPPMKAGGPFTMDISGSNKIQLKDILIGDVWICSGQSNMVIPMERVKEKYPEEVANANYPQIRNFFIPTLTDLRGPDKDLPAGNWKEAVGTDILPFGAVSYFFAKEIYERYHVPIGIINTSVGGTPIEAWISEEGFKDFPDQLKRIETLKDTGYVNRANRSGFRGGGGPRRREEDKGTTGPLPWYDVNYVPKGWHRINIPGYWEDQGVKDFDGVMWYRREIDVPASMTGIPAKLFMGRIVDADFAYINGKLVGNITYQYPPRRYDVPAGILKPGKNLIVMRVTNTAGKGGFVPDKPYYLTAGGQNIDLKGDWQYKVGEVYPPFRGFGGGGGGGGPISAQNQPAALYNAMVAPLINFTAKGFIWYQGEANASRGAEYTKLLPALIADWRNKWNEGSIPFLYVQLPNFMDMQYLPSESQWAQLREAQLKALSVPNTGMAVTIDIGEWNDIHPLDKKDVGKRLSLAAEHLAYGDSQIVYSGPIYKSAEIEGNKIIVTFDHTGSGLVSHDGEELSQFAIAGADKKFVWAKAIIKGNTVITWNDDIPNPLYVRYAWADNPDGANLYNKEGLPASPFRTDE